MIVLVGLGNPGKEYDKTFHNAGYMSIDAFAKHYGLEFTKQKYNADYAEGVIAGQKVILLKPLTYMNLSGNCVAECVRKLKLDTSHLLVVYDDIDLPFGTLRLRQNGSAGTHNGMRSIVSSLATEQFARLRIGIGRDDRKDLRDFVLSKLNKQQLQDFEQNTLKTIKIMYAFVENEGNVERIDVNKY